MQILHVVPSYLPATRYGGPIYSVHGLCAGLVRLGHRVRVVTTSVDGDRDSDVPHGTLVERDGVEVMYCRSRWVRRLYFSPELKSTLVACMPAFEIVHLHSVFLWPTNTAARIAREYGVPYVISPRGMLVRELIERRSAFAKRAWLTLIESTTLAQAHAVHLTSERELEDARKLPLPLPNPFVVPNGVDMPEADRTSGSESSGGRPLGAREAGYALYLGRLNWKKGLDRLIEAVGGTTVRLLICGHDEDGYALALRQQIRAARLERQIELIDEVEGDAKWALIRGARFLVLASYNENFGNVVVEGMAAGRPALVTEEVGAAPLVREAGAGLISTGAVPALRAALEQLWSDPARCARLGQRGREYVLQHLTWDKVAQRMAEVYRRLLASECRSEIRPALPVN